WHTSTAQGVPVVAAIRPAGAAAFGAPQTLDAAAAYGQPATAMATADIASVVWPSRVAGSKSQIFSASTGAGVLPAGTGPPPVGGSTTPPPVVVNPVLTIGKVTLTAPKPKKGKKAPKHGPKYVSVSVTTTAHVAGEVMITKSAKGVVKGTSCVAPPKKKAKGKKPKSCTRVIAVGKPVTAAIDPGKPTVFTFTRTTPVGRYTLSAYGTGTGNVSAKPVSTTFTVK
ncbi:MAG: hypothetical protein REI11_18560, partial [Patulibacter sp.]|nr:hypothetical protein [Patulibacter sp.]